MSNNAKMKSEEALRASEERYRCLVETVVSVIICLGPDFSILEFNREAERVYGFSRGEVLGRNYLELFIPEEFRTAIEQDMQKILDGEPTRGFENPVFARDGTERVLTWKVNRILDDEQNPVGVVCVGQDITERISVERALRESELKYRSLFQDSTDVIFITTSDGRFIDVNDAGLTLFGYTRDEIREMYVHDIYIALNDQNRLRNQFFQKGFIQDHEVTTRKKDGTRIDCLLSITARKADGGSIREFRGMLRDISDRKALEEQLIQAQKMEAVGILAGGVAHDFNNLLTTIQGYNDLAMMHVDEGDPLYKNLRQICQASVRAADLTRQLLLFSRKQPMTFTFFNVNSTVEQIINMLQRLIGEDIGIETRLEPGLWNIRGDQGNIEQVLMNLAVNARDAMPSGGTIIIKTENVYVDEGYSKLYSYARPGEFICLSISDTGTGMSREIKEHLFDPFFTTKRAGQGSGLGLSVVYGIVKQHEGWINVYSELNQGTRFQIYIPAFPESHRAEGERALLLRDVRGEGERILLVEDDAGVREFAKSALSEGGYTVFEAASADRAMHLFEREHGAFHLVFTDVVLPDMTGLQLIEQLLCQNSGLRILLSSGYTDDKSQWEIIQKKGYMFLEKPYGVTHLLGTVRKTITSH